MSNNKPKSNAMENLLNSAKAKEEEVKRIASVVPQEKNETMEENEIIPNNEVTTVGKKINQTSSSSKSGIDYFFNNLDCKTPEAVRISAEVHRKLKLLATCANSTIATIINNILSEELDKHDSEIQKFIRKKLS